MEATVSTRAGDFARSERLGTTYTHVAKELDLARNQSTTGHKGDSYKDIGSDAQNALTISLAKTGAAQHVKNMDFIDQRLGLSEVAVSKTIGIMEEFRSRLTGIIQPSSFDSGFQKFCQDSLNEIAQALNVQDIGRNNVFGGNEWSQPPVNLDALPVPILGGAISTNYYQGSDDILKAPINEGKTLEYGIKADAEGFAKSLHALKIGASIIPDHQEGSNNMQLLRNAMTVAAEATINLSESLSDIGANRKTIDTEKEVINNFFENAEELEQKYIGADVTEAWIRYKQMENQLLGIITASKMDIDLSKQLVTILR